ncbi:uncharacterized protein LOC119685707 isoform X2 [Teleopsis dalmanni]|uniref:uncharacterized protein LOC119685707 isoform X2 n=1 Tax=Teleopsis dalmanni TaxID=139649 RepID=UPI0018CF13C2|nr:uncharacterized protein LOC119685707 isoform X2 [Teleopsis dalmanni]
MSEKINILVCLLFMIKQIVQTQADDCISVKSITNFSPKDIVGVWYEVAKYPPPQYLCTQVKFTLLPNDIMNIQTTYSIFPLEPWDNVTESANVSCKISPEGYDIWYKVLNKNRNPASNMKVVKIHSNSVAYICGYTIGLNDTQELFTSILSRCRIINSIKLKEIEDNAPHGIDGFGSSVMTAVVQIAVLVPPPLSRLWLWF